MMIITSAGALSQWPIGYLSDRIDRRVILIGVSFMASGLSLFFVFANFMPLILFLIFTGLFSVACLPMYSLTVAHTNDFLQPNEIVSAVQHLVYLLVLDQLSDLCLFLDSWKFWER